MSNGKILVVDDEPSILGVIKETLADDYTVTTATNGKEALAVLEKNRPDIIISDIAMPLMDGLELLKNLKKMDLGIKIPLLFLTAKGQVSDMEKGLALGAYGYIVKPFLPTQLLEKVAEMFEKLSARKRMKK